MAASFMAQFGGALVANGWPILPIQPGTKKPGRYRSGFWSDYPDWPRHATRATTENELAIWREWPDAGVGIVCGTVVAVDIDLEVPELASAIEELARERLGDTPLRRIGRAPKRLLVYRATEPFRGIRRAPLEILGEGQQFVAHAIHPDTGRPYDWPNGPPADRDLSDLPVVERAAVEAFLDEAIAMLPDEVKPARLSVGRSIGDGISTSREGTREAIAAALAYVPNADLAYDDWIRVGLALKGALGDDGTDLFVAWSAQSGKDEPDFTEKTWAGLKPERIGAGTIYRLGLDAGWKPEPALVLDGATPRRETHPAAAMLAKVQADPRKGLAPEPPIQLTMPDGLVGELTEYMVSTARRPQPLLSLGASLCAIGALMGRRFRTESNLRSNLYVVGIADSGSGKNHSREIINELFLEAGLVEYLGGNKIASGAGLLSALYRQPALLLQLDEFGMFLSAAADRRRSPRHITEILDNMTELYTAAGGVYFGAEYANRDGKNERRDINQPCLCVYGTTTPVHFWSALKEANVVDGSLARFLIMETEEDYPEEIVDRGIRSAPSGLLDQMRRVAMGGASTAGNLAGLGSGLSTGVEPVTVPMASAAKEVFRSLGADVTRQLREARGTTRTAVLARIAENAAKLALIVAVGRDPERPRIEAGDAHWAISLTQHCSRRTMLAVDRHVADNDNERHRKRVLEIIRTAGGGGLTKSELVRKTQFLPRRDRDDVLADLAETGCIAVRMVPSATKPAAVFVATEAGAG
ncbi:bifunctional DNA primase/polymerase [Acuticoccus mangrovi]|uniref:Bifunctional DNA primase/polymerase n=1 Tax=Acuticoccus mangrovi TaxID=2796142 RepID=A0A934MP74_9HYPH|nr:bifunctional DNA primase/polymerase [Acuticoccus mangrovi]MBJ3778844.1 bifunctional DNA primase/polymerase [Acuticoccus mangrovi]